MARILLDDRTVDDETVRAVHERTDGIPLHVEELLGTLADGPTTTVDDVRASRVPDTIEATVLERLGHRSPAARQVAAAGAVLGRRFSPGMVGRILDRSEDELAEPVAELVAHAFLEELPPTGEVDFRNQLVRDAIYGAIPVGERRRLHGIVAGLADGSADGYRDPGVGPLRAGQSDRRCLSDGARRGGRGRSRLGAPRGDGALPPSGPQPAGRAAVRREGPGVRGSGARGGDPGRDHRLRRQPCGGARGLRRRGRSAFCGPGGGGPRRRAPPAGRRHGGGRARSRGRVAHPRGHRWTGGRPRPRADRGCAGGRAVAGQHATGGPGARSPCGRARPEDRGRRDRARRPRLDDRHPARSTAIRKRRSGSSAT